VLPFSFESGCRNRRQCVCRRIEPGAGRDRAPASPHFWRNQDSHRHCTYFGGRDSERHWSVLQRVQPYVWPWSLPQKPPRRPTVRFPFVLLPSLTLCLSEHAASAPYNNNRSVLDAMMHYDGFQMILLHVGWFPCVLLSRQLCSGSSIRKSSVSMTSFTLIKSLRPLPDRKSGQNFRLLKR